MVLVDKGNGKDLEFGHTDYRTGEGRGVTHSENIKERYINPELTVEKRRRISGRDTRRRNHYAIYLLNENNTIIAESVCYNPFTENLSLTCHIRGNHGKRLRRVSEPETGNESDFLKRD